MRDSKDLSNPVVEPQRHIGDWLFNEKLLPAQLYVFFIELS
jgi:hypothetical protein